LKEFDPEDIDIRVEKGKLILQGEREVRRGNSFSKRHFNQRLELPDGVDVDNMFSEVRSGGRLIITAPQVIGLKLANSYKFKSFYSSSIIAAALRVAATKMVYYPCYIRKVR